MTTPIAAKRKHTLEGIVETLGTGVDLDRVHAALLLAFAEGVYRVVRQDCSPAPLYRLTYDARNNKVGMEVLSGASLPPDDGSLDVSLLDILFCSNLRDIPVLLEGETGIGKTFVAMKYLATILKKENFFSYRLSSNAFVNNMFSHFQEGKMVNGMPVITARKDRIKTCAGGMLDEINRGDSNESLQLLECEMHLGGEINKLGIPIPDISPKGYVPESGRIKKLMLVCAQNPAGVDDAKFTQTLQLDAAVDNRLLKMSVGNASKSTGATLWLGETTSQPHTVFLDYFASRASAYLGVDKPHFQHVQDDWLGVYAWITEASKTDKPILYSALELADNLIGILSGKVIDYFEGEKKISNAWHDILGRGPKISEAMQETKHVKEVEAVSASFNVPVIFRDVVQIKKLSDVLATLKNVKDALKSSDPLQVYHRTQKYVTIREVAGATAMLCQNKQSANAPSSIPVINEVLTQYVDLIKSYMSEAKVLATAFQVEDPNAGIKKVAVYKAVKDTLEGTCSVDSLITHVAEQADYLAKKISVSEDIKNVLIARSVADLMTLCGFLRDYKAELASEFKQYSKKTRAQDMIQKLGEFYYKKQQDCAVVFPEVYQQRIQRTLGV